jgi:hypothetical protein
MIWEGLDMERFAVFASVGLPILMGSFTDSWVRAASGARMRQVAVSFPGVSCQVPHAGGGAYPGLEFGLVFDREFDQRVAAAQFQFCSDIVAVMVNRTGADIQFTGDFTAGAALGNQLQDAPFSGR